MTDLTYGSAPAERLFVSIIRLLKNVTIEPVVFLYALGFSLTIIVTPSLYMQKICEVRLVEVSYLNKKDTSL